MNSHVAWRPQGNLLGKNILVGPLQNWVESRILGQMYSLNFAQIQNLQNSNVHKHFPMLVGVELIVQNIYNMHI